MDRLVRSDSLVVRLASTASGYLVPRLLVSRAEKEKEKPLVSQVARAQAHVDENS